MSSKGSDFDREMSRLEAEIKRLEAEYNMFFAGRLPRLPWETRARVEQLIKQYDRMNLSNTAQRFRFGSVQAKFMSFCELWERNLKAREEGRGPRGRTPAPAMSAPSSVPEPTPGQIEHAAPPEPPVVKPAPVEPRDPVPAPAPAASARAAAEATRIRDIGRDSDRLTALYDELTRARSQAGDPPMPFDRFATVVKAQVAKLGGGSGEVAFRVTLTEGKVTLLAKKVDE
jgi:hypothetical protein